MKSFHIKPSKKFGLVILFMYSTIFSSHVHAKSKPQPIKAPELIIFSESQHSATYKIDEKDKVVSDLFDATAHQNSTTQVQPIFVYIHGRALGQIKNGYDKEPEESEQCCIAELFSRYNASKVLMFHWHHWGNGNDYNSPAEDARLSGIALAELLLAIDNRFSTEKKVNRPLILISHSMGSIVLEDALIKSPSLNLSGFHTVAIFSPASRYDQSWIWLSKIKSENRYVFSNDHDPVLRPVNDTLGECGVKCLTTRPLSADVVYIDISPLKLGHRYFVFGTLEGTENNLFGDVVKPILTGEKPKFQGDQPYAAKSIYSVH